MPNALKIERLKVAQLLIDNKADTNFINEKGMFIYISMIII